MTFNDKVVALGITSYDNSVHQVTRIVELTEPNDCKGRTLDQVIFVKDVVDADNEWAQAVYYATVHSKHQHRITRLITP